METTQSTVPLLNPESIDLVIYHKNCTDGFGSAFSVWWYFQKINPSKVITWFPASHGNPRIPSVTGLNVLICDFSYDKTTLSKMISEAKSLLVIDHHITAQKELESIDPQYKIFDMNHSGAVLTWSFLFPNESVPLLFKYIEDRDIWKKELPNTDAFSAFFYILPFEFEVYAKYMNDAYLVEQINTTGLAYCDLNNYNIKDIAKYVRPKFCQIKGKYYFVGYINSNVLRSDIGNCVFESYPLLSFSAVYNINDWNNSTVFSLRSLNENSDVSAVAKHFGGGGHRNASGCTVESVVNMLPSSFVDCGELYDVIKNIYFGQVTVGSDKYNVVYLMASTYMIQLGYYLLQNRNEKLIQNCTYIHNMLHPDAKLDTTIRIDIAMVWYTDSQKQHTHLAFDSNAVRTAFMTAHKLENPIHSSEIENGMVNIKPFTLSG